MGSIALAKKYVPDYFPATFFSVPARQPTPPPDPTAASGTRPGPIRKRTARSPAWVRKAKLLPHIDVSYDADKAILWHHMACRDVPSFTPGLIDSMTTLLDLVDRACDHPEGEPTPIRHMVLASRVPGIFNLGGDLKLFLDLIANGDRERLRWYAHSCVNGQFRYATNLGRPICTIALIQGDALGGGFEAALAQQVIVAERQARFGLPEVLFNLFPGMGAYSFLARRLSAQAAERMIISGKVYTAAEMHELGVVDVLAEDGCGVEAVHGFIAEYERKSRCRRALFQARTIVNPINLEELSRVADLWVEAALALERADLRKMQHLATAQARRLAIHRANPQPAPESGT